MGIELNEKIKVIEDRIANLNIHIDILSKDLQDNPTEDVDGKPSRSSVLSNFLSKKQILEQELGALTN